MIIIVKFKADWNNAASAMFNTKYIMGELVELSLEKLVHLFEVKIDCVRRQIEEPDFVVYSAKPAKI